MYHLRLDVFVYKVVSATVARIVWEGVCLRAGGRQPNNAAAYKRLYFSLNAFGEASMKRGAIMSTPIQKEFGLGYDYPNRKFNFLAVILPTVVLVALAVALMRDIASTSSKATRSPIVTCPRQMCPAPGSTGPAKSAQPAKKTSTSAAGLSVAETADRDLSSPTVTSALGSAPSQTPSPSPSSKLSPTQTSRSSSPSASPVLSVTRPMLSQSSSAVTHAVVLSSA